MKSERIAREAKAAARSKAVVTKPSNKQPVRGGRLHPQTAARKPCADFRPSRELNAFFTPSPEPQNSAQSNFNYKTCQEIILACDRLTRPHQGHLRIPAHADCNVSKGSKVTQFVVPGFVAKGDLPQTCLSHLHRPLAGSRPLAGFFHNNAYANGVERHGEIRGVPPSARVTFARTSDVNNPRVSRMPGQCLQALVALRRDGQI